MSVIIYPTLYFVYLSSEKCIIFYILIFHFFYIPILSLIIGKYGHLRLQYLKEHKKAEYTIMLLDGALRKHIVDIDIQAKERLEILMKQMLHKNPIDENLKDTAPLKWTGLMNNYKHSHPTIAERVR